MRIVEKIIGILASLMLASLAALTLFDVVGRNIFHRPLNGAIEISEFVLVGVVFMLYPLIAFRQKHISVDLFDWMMAPLAQRFQQALAGSIGAALFGVLSWQLWKQAVRTAAYQDVTPYWKLSMSSPIYFMAILTGISAIAFAITVLTAFSSPVDQLNGCQSEIRGVE